MSRRLFAALLAVCLWGYPRPALAQLYGFNIKGDQGAKSGTQPPPGAAVGAPLYWYGTDTIKNRDGKALDIPGDLNMFIGGPLLNVVTTRTVLGANYGFAVVLPFANTRLEIPRLDHDPGAGVSDMYVQPINLGWHLPRADMLAGYGFFAPTGRYAEGAKDNTGLGMWGHELFAGTTVFFDQNKAWHAATTAAMEFHSQKQDSVAQVGTLLTLEGGFGRDFLMGAASVGLAYYSQWKVTEDTLAPIPDLILRGKNRVAGLGPELTLPIAARNTVYGFVTVRYQWELGARTTTEGDAWNVLLVVPFKPIKAAP